ncbi:DUF4476 domain-containing protein [Carboxylicivirga sp. RSCT41]|uniref:DUF4476 domain-containing protein n=1 Tax=Carboxylicivirga agarovorans TaxID=3417570 RepID=UPI003D345AB4
MKRNMLLMVVVLLAGIVNAQKVTYNLPGEINKESVNITFEKVSSSSTNYYINYKVKNQGDGILFIDRSQASLEQNKGQIKPASSEYVLRPTEAKTIFNQFRVKPPVQANSDFLKLSLNGFSYAMPAKPLDVDPFIVSEKAIKTVDAFALKIMEYNTYPDRVYVNVKCLFNGASDKVGQVDLSKLNVSGGEAEVVKKGDVIMPGKSYSFSINIKPNGEEVSLDFTNVLHVLTLQSLVFDTIDIKSTSYVEPKAAKDSVKTVEAKATKETAKVAELSYSDVVTLKKDIEQEMNTGGKAVEMANEFLMEKGHISTAQVIDVMSVFNLDGAKLKFAKMAYPYVSDKVKYHMVVAKLSYTKNKQALEEFLEMQE